MNITLALSQLLPPLPLAAGPGITQLQPPLPPDLAPLPPELAPLRPPELPPVDPERAARFAELMSHSRLGAAQPVERDGGAVISDLVRNEDIALQYVSNDVLFLLEHADGMSMNQFATAAMQVQIEAASLQVDMQAKMAVVTSSKDAIETLMKNQ
jgi:type III secretion inner rod protein HrpB2